MNARLRVLIALAAAAAITAPALTARAQGPGDAWAVTDKTVLVPDFAPHMTANVRTGDLLGDGSVQVFAAEPLRGQVIWMRRPDDFVAFQVGLRQPVRTHVVDLDGDSDRDLLVADIGSLIPSDENVGRVVLQRNVGGGRF
ncbi:MAG: hypothetical protein FJ319_03815 [SAR202 cluster bacterium]|nr:hypothetical protein [SAR202 cluster bacterium]